MRTMKVGGNASATEFFTKHGGSSLLHDSDTKTKYSSRVAELYKEELAKRAKEDAIRYLLHLFQVLLLLKPTCRYPERIFVEGIEASPTPPSQPEDEDFFTSWNKPSSKPGTPALSPPTSSPPSIGRSASAASSTTSIVAPAPRTITSSSFRSSSTPASGRTNKLGASRLTSGSSITSTSTAGAGGSTAAKKSKLGGLGAKKTAAPIDFAEAERRAQAEAEHIKQLGYDKQREEEEEKKRKEAEKAQAATSAKAKEPKIGNGKAATSISAKVETPRGNNQDLERLGMGFKKLGFGALPSAAPQTAARSKYTA
jgi:ADP-ribosylation factor GTPase-activating protein 2/3